MVMPFIGGISMKNNNDTRKRREVRPAIVISTAALIAAITTVGIMSSVVVPSYLEVEAKEKSEESVQKNADISAQAGTDTYVQEEILKDCEYGIETSKLACDGKVASTDTSALECAVANLAAADDGLKSFALDADIVMNSTDEDEDLGIFKKIYVKAQVKKLKALVTSSVEEMQAELDAYLESNDRAMKKAKKKLTNFKSKIEKVNSKIAKAITKLDEIEGEESALKAELISYAEKAASTIDTNQLKNEIIAAIEEKTAVSREETDALLALTDKETDSLSVEEITGLRALLESSKSGLYAQDTSSVSLVASDTNAYEQSTAQTSNTSGTQTISYSDSTFISLKTDIGIMQASLAAIESKNASQDENIANIYITMNSQQKSIDSALSTNESQQKSIDNLSSASESQQKSINGAVSTNESQQKSIDNLSSASESQQKSIDELSSTSEAQQKSIDALSSAVASGQVDTGELISAIEYQLGDCRISYEDGHFYIIYEGEGADSVVKKLN